MCRVFILLSQKRIQLNTDQKFKAMGEIKRLESFYDPALFFPKAMNITSYWQVF
jgi:hypothetical protein